MIIRNAEEKDIAGINVLLRQVLDVHHAGRPDLFRAQAKKYDDAQLAQIIRDPDKPIFVAIDELGEIAGYAFCIVQRRVSDPILTDILTLYIDDLCVAEQCRGQRIGRTLYEYVVQYAKRIGCYNLTLNVWACNENAMRFYQNCGLTPQKIGMEKIL